MEDGVVDEGCGAGALRALNGQSGNAVAEKAAPVYAGQTSLKLPVRSASEGTGWFDVLAGNDFAAPFLRPKEKGLLFGGVVDAGDEDRSADGVAEVVLLVFGTGTPVPLFCQEWR